MQLKNCASCGKIMQGGLRKICPECAEKREKSFLAVRDFIKDNPKVSIEVVVEATGVPEQEVRQLLREGLIEAADLDGAPLTCQRCGKQISRGLYCAICQQQFTSSDGEAKGKDQDKENKHSLILEYKKNK